MNNQDFRLFINNITENINEESLRTKLSQFGDVSSIQLKQRKNIIGNQTEAFAYININTSPENIQKCFKDFSTHKFENVYIDISIAKESFMERLKREREKNHNDNDQKNKKFNERSQQGLISNSSIIVPNETSSFPSKISKYSSVVKKVPQENNAKPLLSMSEQKRIHSILEKKKEYHSQKLLVQNALSRIDIKPKSKLIFYENEDFMASNDGKAISEMGKKHKDKFLLFTDDDDNETNSKWFEVKDHFEGIKGQKLLKLQSRFKNDPRFSMDSRFLENDIEEEGNFEEEESTKENTIKNDDEERKAQMQILEQVLGKKITSSKHTSISESSGKTLGGMIRYDPNDEDHLKYEITPHLEKHSRNKKKLDIEVENSAETECNEAPPVSKEKFYKVTNNLKDALFTGQQFSILGAFGEQYENENNKQNNASVSKKKGKKESITTSNPFAYDSSSDSEDDKKSEKIGTEDAFSYKTQKLWTESFFFVHDDYRLQEGLDFVKRLEVNEAMDFVKLRRNIKEAVRAKIKNNEKKFNPFKKKLGEMKRIKIKRALKR